MTDADLAPAPDLVVPGRPADCKAVDVDGVSTCYRCGLQWGISDAVAPACNPMTFRRMHDRLLREISSAEAWVKVATELKNEKAPVDPLSARAKLAELEALLRVFEKVTGSKEGREFLNGKPA
jgi:hypothetical protein